MTNKSVAKEIQDFLDRQFLRYLEAHSRMTSNEEKQSMDRSISYEKQWEEFKKDQRNKYGLDGGPSPCMIMKDKFQPHD